jgi:hypothetical protein
MQVKTQAQSLRDDPLSNTELIDQIKTLSRPPVAAGSQSDKGDTIYLLKVLKMSFFLLCFSTEPLCAYGLESQS